MAICESYGLFLFFHWKILPFICVVLPYPSFCLTGFLTEDCRGSSVYNITTRCAWEPGCCTHWKIWFPRHCLNLHLFYLSRFSGCTCGSLAESSGSGSWIGSLRYDTGLTFTAQNGNSLTNRLITVNNTCDKEKWCLYRTNNANTKIMGKLLFLIYYLMDFFSAVYITHYDINFISYSFTSP